MVPRARSASTVFKFQRLSKAVTLYDKQMKIVWPAIIRACCFLYPLDLSTPNVQRIMSQNQFKHCLLLLQQLLQRGTNIFKDMKERRYVSTVAEGICFSLSSDFKLFNITCP